MLEFAYCVLVLAELKSVQKVFGIKAKGYAEGMTRGLAVVCDVCIYVIIIRIVFLLSHFFSVIAVHDNSRWWRAREICERDFGVDGESCRQFS